MKRRSFFGAALAGAAFATPVRLLAHVGHFDSSPVLVYRTRRPPDGGTIELSILLNNTFGVAATLRGLSSPIAEGIVIQRKRNLFGVEAWQSVSLLRLDVGERLNMAPPEYSVVAFGVEAPLTERLVFELVADFGLLGAYVSYANIRAAETNPPPQTTE